MVNVLATSSKNDFWENNGADLTKGNCLGRCPADIERVDVDDLASILDGNFPQRVRWMVYRYLLRQSIGYFNDEFAGRIAQRLMQTALAVREVALKIMDVGSYVTVYFIGALTLTATLDWRLAIPFNVGFLYALMLWQLFRVWHGSPPIKPMRAA